MSNGEPISKERLLSLGVRFSGQVYKYWICQISHGAQQVRRYVIPDNPKTPAQQARRSKFAQAVSAGQALDDAQKLYWGKIGTRKKEPLPWWNAFLSAYMKDLVNPVTKNHVRNLQIK